MLPGAETVLWNNAKEIASQGTGWMLFVVAIVLLGWLYVAKEKLARDWSTKYDALADSCAKEAAKRADEYIEAIAEATEKRIAEMRETIRTLNEGTAVNARLADAQAARTSALENLSNMVTAMYADIKTGRETWNGRAGNIEGTLKEIRDRVERIERKRGANGDS
jgi:uncharacterized coiled-coil DUF342 family protein